jgi:5-methylcytosine-specific restriction endonuclease McrA
MLNADYMPLQTIGWQRAVTLYFQGKVEIVAEYEDQLIRSWKITIKMPSIVRLLQFVRVLNKQIKFSRQNIYLRDKFTCQYCGARYGETDLTFDHVIPRARGGRTTWENIVTCCYACNLKKGGRTPGEARMRLIKQPLAPAWLPQVTIRITMKSAPEAWRDFLYWHGAIES